MENNNLVSVNAKAYLKAKEDSINGPKEMQNIVERMNNLAGFKYELAKFMREDAVNRQEYNVAVENFDVENESQKVIEKFKLLGNCVETFETWSYPAAGMMINNCFKDSSDAIAKVMGFAFETNKWPEVFDKVVCSISESLLGKKLNGETINVSYINKYLYDAKNKMPLLCLQKLVQANDDYNKDYVKVNKVVTNSDIRFFKERSKSLQQFISQIDAPYTDKRFETYIEFNFDKEARKYVDNLMNPHSGMGALQDITDRAINRGELGRLNEAIEKELLQNPELAPQRIVSGAIAKRTETEALLQNPADDFKAGIKNSMPAAVEEENKLSKFRRNVFGFDDKNTPKDTPKSTSPKP